MSTIVVVCESFIEVQLRLKPISIKPSQSLQCRRMYRLVCYCLNFQWTSFWIFKKLRFFLICKHLVLLFIEPYQTTSIWLEYNFRLILKELNEHSCWVFWLYKAQICSYKFYSEKWLMMIVIWNTVDDCRDSFGKTINQFDNVRRSHKIFIANINLVKN